MATVRSVEYAYKANMNGFTAGMEEGRRSFQRLTDAGGEWTEMQRRINSQFEGMGSMGAGWGEQIARQLEASADLDDRIRQATSSPMDLALDDLDTRYQDMRLKWSDNESMMTKITQAESAERSKIMNDYVGDIEQSNERIATSAQDAASGYDGVMQAAKRILLPLLAIDAAGKGLQIVAGLISGDLDKMEQAVRTLPAGLGKVAGGMIDLYRATRDQIMMVDELTAAYRRLDQQTADMTAASGHRYEGYVQFSDVEDTLGRAERQGGMNQYDRQRDDERLRAARQRREIQDLAQQGAISPEREQAVLALAESEHRRRMYEIRKQEWAGQRQADERMAKEQERVAAAAKQAEEQRQREYEASPTGQARALGEQLGLEAKLFGLTANEANLYRLALEGASQAELTYARQQVDRLEAMQQYAAAQERARQVVERNKTEQERYQEQLAEANDLYAQGLLTQEQYARELERIADASGPGTGSRNIQAGSVEQYRPDLQMYGSVSSNSADQTVQRLDKQLTLTERIRQLLDQINDNTRSGGGLMEG